MQPPRNNHQVGKAQIEKLDFKRPPGEARKAAMAVAPRRGRRHSRLPLGQANHRMAMGTSNENDQADRAISNGKLHTLLRFHTRPIDVVVYHGSDREHSFSGGFPA